MSTLEWAHTNKVIGVPSQIVAITWMGMSAFVDGSITLILVLCFRRRASSRLVNKLTTLTLETVLLTHLCGAAMCIIFLAGNPNHRTDKDIFWVLIEIITELYALSMLFTINSRRTLRPADSVGAVTTHEASMLEGGFGVTEVERRVEGYQGDTPFGVVVDNLVYEAVGTHSSQSGETSDQKSSEYTSASGTASGWTTTRSVTTASPPAPFTQEEFEKPLEVR